MPDTLGQRVIVTLINFGLNNWSFFVILAVLVVFGFQWYHNNIKVNRHTDNMDLMKRYTNLQLRRRYKL